VLFERTAVLDPPSHVAVSFGATFLDQRPSLFDERFQFPDYILAARNVSIN
jgi:hypothetical protein